MAQRQSTSSRTSGPTNHSDPPVAQELIGVKASLVDACALGQVGAGPRGSSAVRGCLQKGRKEGRNNWTRERIDTRVPVSN